MSRVARILGAFLMLAVAGAAAAADAPPVVSDAWARATPPGVDVGAAYLTIDGGSRDDRLVAASTDRAKMVHLHTVEEQDGVAKMRATDAVAVPADRRVTLAPKSTHLMLMGLAAPLVEGQSFVVKLEFEVSGTQDVTVRVEPATGPGDGSQRHH